MAKIIFSLLLCVRLWGLSWKKGMVMILRDDECKYEETQRKSLQWWWFFRWWQGWQVWIWSPQCKPACFLHEFATTLFYRSVYEQHDFRIANTKDGPADDVDDDSEGEKVNHENGFQIANEEEESTFCLEHGMEYARDNPQKVKSLNEAIGSASSYI